MSQLPEKRKINNPNYIKMHYQDFEVLDNLLEDMFNLDENEVAVHAKIKLIMLKMREFKVRQEKMNADSSD